MPTIRFATFLSPVLYRTYEYIAAYVGERIGFPTTLSVGRELADFAQGKADIGFMCGLLYVRMTQAPACPVELLAAPVLLGERYRSAPIYFSDVVVRSESRYRSFDDLAGCIWAYNERASHSGCNLVCYSLLQRDKAPHYFGKTVASGSHQRSLEMVLAGRADAAALDSHLLDVLLTEQPQLAGQLRIVAMLGPSSIPPLVVSKSLDPALKQRIRMALLTMHRDASAADELRRGRIERFVAIADEHYNDIRHMLSRVQAAEFAFE